MSGFINKAIIIGNLGSNPEIRQTQDGTKIANFSVATNEYWRTKDTNERKEKTEWHRIVIFNDRLADVSEKYLKKGMKVYIEGQLQTRKWNDSEGKEHVTTEIVLPKYRGELYMLDGNKSGSDASPSNKDSGPSKTSEASNLIDDEIPF